jgi:hypothetical protein
MVEFFPLLKTFAYSELWLSMAGLKDNARMVEFSEAQKIQ